MSAAREAKGADGGAAGTRWNSPAGSRQYAAPAMQSSTAKLQPRVVAGRAGHAHQPRAAEHQSRHRAAAACEQASGKPACRDAKPGIQVGGVRRAQRRHGAHGRYGGCSLLPAGRNSQHRQRGGGAGDGQPQYRVGRQAGQQRHKGEAKRGALLGVLRHSALPGHGKKAHQKIGQPQHKQRFGRGGEDARQPGIARRGQAGADETEYDARRRGGGHGRIILTARTGQAAQERHHGRAGQVRRGVCQRQRKGVSGRRARGGAHRVGCGHSRREAEPQRAQAAQQRRAGAQPAQQCGAKLERERQKALGHARAHRLSHHGPFTEFDGHVGHHSFLPGFSGTALDGVRRICPLSFPARAGRFPEERHKPRAGRISMAGYPQL